MKKVTIFEPHFDDAWINLGGLMLANRKRQNRIRLVSFSNYPTNNNFNLDGLKQAIPNLEYIFLGYKSLGFGDEHDSQMRIKIKHTSDINLFMKINQLKTKNSIQKEIGTLTEGEDEVYWPMGLKHPQHRIMSEFLPDSNERIYIYREFPYYFYSDQTEIIEILLSETTKRKTINVKRYLPKKISLFRELYPDQRFILDLNINKFRMADLSTEIFWETSIQDFKRASSIYNRSFRND